jgi:hypothetical protein
MFARTIVSAIAAAVSCGSALAENDSVSHRLHRVEPKYCEFAEHHIPDSARLLLSLHPHGGDALTGAVYAAIVENPVAARSMVVAANLANPEQIVAIVRGVLQALERLETYSPECRLACPSQGDDWRNRAVPAEASPGDQLSGEAINEERARANLGDTCGDPVRAAMLCAEGSVDAVMTALAAQSFAVGDASISGHCNAPIYAGGHSFSGWSVSVAPRVSRN